MRCYEFNITDNLNMSETEILEMANAVMKDECYRLEILEPTLIQESDPILMADGGKQYSFYINGTFARNFHG